MASTFSNENIWKGEIFSFSRIFQIFRRLITGDRTSRQEIARFEKAVRTMRLAAEPGEEYPLVAARIEREASTYRTFLQHPQPIGKISLIVKELNPHSPDFTKPRTQIEVANPSEGHRDPAEGCASAGYKFNRSDTKVLEFMVHDVNESPLFAIVRTYSNWVGNREFALGLNRVFYLNMIEDAPGYVMVYAGFRTVADHERVTGKPKTLQAVGQMPVPVIAGSGAGRRFRGFWQPYGQRRRSLVGLECAAISVICSSVFWMATHGASSKDPSRPNQSQVVSSVAGVLPAAGETITSVNKTDTFDAINGGLLVSTDRSLRAKNNVRIRLAQKAKRLAEVKAFSVAVDNSSCKPMESRCLELLSTVQKGVQSSLSSLSVPVYSLDQTGNGAEPAKLVVSYNPIDLLHGQIHLTLYDQQGALWDDKGNLTFAEISQPSVVTTYCEEASSEILWQIITAKIRVNANSDKKGNDSSKSE